MPGLDAVHSWESVWITFHPSLVYFLIFPLSLRVLRQSLILCGIATLARAPTEQNHPLTLSSLPIYAAFRPPTQVAHFTHNNPSASLPFLSITKVLVALFSPHFSQSLRQPLIHIPRWSQLNSDLNPQIPNHFRPPAPLGSGCFRHSFSSLSRLTFELALFPYPSSRSLHIYHSSSFGPRSFGCPIPSSAVAHDVDRPLPSSIRGGQRLTDAKQILSSLVPFKRTVRSFACRCASQTLSLVY